MPMMKIATQAMRGASRLLRVAKDKAATKEMHKEINLGTSRIMESSTVRGIASKRKVAEVRAEIMRPKPIPSVYETGQIRHPQNAWKQPQSQTRSVGQSAWSQHKNSQRK